MGALYPLGQWAFRPALDLVSAEILFGFESEPGRRQWPHLLAPCAQRKGERFVMTAIGERLGWLDAGPVGLVQELHRNLLQSQPNLRSLCVVAQRFSFVRGVRSYEHYYNIY